jgi:integrase
MFGDANILEIELTDIIKWIKNPRLSSRSRLNYYRVINQFFIWAKEEKHISDNPLSTVSKNKLQEIIGRQDEKPPAIYTPREAQLLLEAAIGEEVFPLLVIGFFCGLRTAELQRLEWEHIRFDENEPFVTVFPSNAKSRSLRNVELKKVALEWLSLCDAGEGIIFDKVQQTYNEHRTKIHEKAGVEKRDNGLRHSFGSYHYAMYGDEIRTATQMGHNPNDHSLFSNYRALVSKAAAEAFWAIKAPSKNKKLVQFPS